MKTISSILLILFIASGASGKKSTYIGSTPAGNVIRSFLGIPLSDSVDFVRWKLMLGDHRYQLQCNYGIGKANTNGFLNGGIKIEISGAYKKEQNYYQFQNGTKTLKAVELNADLIHLLNNDKSLLVGNEGWSYTLNSTNPLNLEEVTITAAPGNLNDSVAFEGRTPCNVPGIIAPDSQCYKLKWYVVLYANTQINRPATYKVLGTLWRNESGRTGTWKIIAGEKGQTTYRLNDENEDGFLYLLKLDERILVFTDARGKLLVGNEDFSYTLNRR